MRLLCVDPGTLESGWALLEDGLPEASGTMPNGELLAAIRSGGGADALVVEEVRSYGMPVGREVLETVKWTGRFAEAADRAGLPVHWMGRKEVVLSLCGSPRGNDATVRRALLDRFGPKGTKARPGILYGCTGDAWQAVALGCAWLDRGLAG